MNVTSATLTSDEAARLRVGVNVIVRAGDEQRTLVEPTDSVYWNSVDPTYVAPQDWVALTGPCPTCVEHLRHMGDGHWHDDCWQCKHRRVHGGDGLAGCLNTNDCRDGRRIVPLYTECPHCDGKGYTPAWFGRGAIQACDCVDDATPTDELDGRVLVGRGSIEVVPVSDSSLGRDPVAYLDSHGLWLLNVRPGIQGVAIPRKALDPLPVLGRDWVIVIDCVEVAP